jgi:hypothetical protein
MHELQALAIGDILIDHYNNKTLMMIIGVVNYAGFHKQYFLFKLSDYKTFNFAGTQFLISGTEKVL